MTHYELLGVTAAASDDEIRTAYVRLARAHHPDRAGAGPGSMRRMQDLNEAWRVLSDPGRRRAYDAMLSVERGRRRRPSRPEPEWAGDHEWLRDRPGLLPEDPPGRRRPALALPALTLAFGVACMVLSLTTGLRLLLLAGVAGLALAGTLFVAVPLLVLTDARRRER